MYSFMQRQRKRKRGGFMGEETPHIEVRTLHVNDAPALDALGYSFETDRIYSLRVCNRFSENAPQEQVPDRPVFTFELVETAVDPPIYKDYLSPQNVQQGLEAKVHSSEGGFVALADGQVAGGVILNIEEWRSVVRIDELIVGRQFRRYGVGSLLLSCAADWARHQGCWAIVLETQNINYPAIQFYLRNGLEIWSINRHFYPPGAVSHEVAIIMGKKLSSNAV